MSIRRGQMKAILPQTIRGRVQQMGDLFGRGKCGEEFGQESVLAATAGFNEDFAGGRALVVQSISEADPLPNAPKFEGKGASSGSIPHRSLRLQGRRQETGAWWGAWTGITV